MPDCCMANFEGGEIKPNEKPLIQVCNLLRHKLKMENEPKPSLYVRTVQSIYTFVVFIGFLLLIPVYCGIFFCVKICRYFWLRRLIRKNPDLEVVKHLTVRSAMDTYRCQGIVSVLLQIRGQCNVELVKQKIMEDVIEKRNADGTLRFPHMKRSLTSCWGRYAWHKDTSGFDIQNHVIHVAEPTLRNRVVTSDNIREFVSDAITKYLPPWNKIPPWQIMLITTEPDRFYILARVHHLYISEDGISFSHLLMIDPDEQWIQHTQPEDMDSIENILQTIFRKPKALPLLYNNVCETFSNAWNRLISAYDPLKNPYLLKSSPNIFHFNMIYFVTLLSAIREYWRIDSNEGFSVILHREIAKRRINSRFFVRCFVNTLYPLIIIKIIIAWWWWFCVKCILHLPISTLHVLYDTPVYMKWFFLILRAIGELIYLSRLMYTAPRLLLDELIIPMFRSPKHHLQTVSLSGRKVVTWTDPIPIDLIRRIRDKTGVASCEVQLYGVAAALHHYLKVCDLPETPEILTTTRFVAQEQLLMFANRISSGLLCLPLPMNLPEDDSVYGLHLMQLALQEAMSTQTALYVASLWQYDYGVLTTLFPSIISRIVLYVLSSRYSVMLTQVEAHDKEMKKRRLIWGQEVESFIYWRPPQANVSLSMTLINYGDEMRFAVMADAQLSPEYAIIVSQYESFLKRLAEDVDNFTMELMNFQTSEL